jgi:hypothetical protein
VSSNLRRVDLDLGYREARRYLFRVGDLCLVLREPSFSHIETCKAVQGLDPASQELIQFLDWKPEDLADIMDLCAELPMHATVKLVTTCRDVFQCSDMISFENFKYLSEPIGSGRLRQISAKAIQDWKDNRGGDQLNVLLERLGVVIKPRPPKQEGETEQGHKDFAWLPLTAAFNPVGYNKIQASLSYNPETWEEEQETRNKLLELEDPDKRDREFGGSGNTKRELMVQTISGDRGVSLTMMPKAQYAALIKSTAVGFVAAHEEGIALRTYHSAVERNMNPKFLAEKAEQLDQARESDLKKLEESADGTVTMRSRWRSRNND